MTETDAGEQTENSDQDARIELVVPVGSATAVRRSAPLALQLAAARGGRVTFLAVRPLRYERAGHLDAVPVWLDDAVDELRGGELPQGVEVDAAGRLAQSVVGGIVAVVRERKRPILLLHWDASDASISHAERDALRNLFTQPPCTVLLSRGDYEPRGAPRLLLEVDSEPSSEAAREMALTLLAADGGGTLRLLVVAAADASDERLKAAIEEARAQAPELPSGAELLIRGVRARSRGTAILAELAEEGDDLAITAARREGVIRALARVALPTRLLEPAPTPVLIVSRPESRPLTVFHGVWGRIYGSLPKLSEADKVAAYMQLRRSSRADTDYYVLMVLAAAVAVLGLAIDSAAVVIGAMLIAPLMSPIAAVALGVVQGDARLIGIASRSVASGTMLAVLTALVLAWLIPGVEPTGEFEARTEPGVLDLLVALGSGIAAAYAISRPDVSAALPGVAVAAALVPPLSAVAMAVALGSWSDAGGASLLFGTNLVAIAAASALTFLWLGFRPAADRVGRQAVFGRGALGLLVLLVVITGPLGWLTWRAAEQDELAGRVRDVLSSAAEERGYEAFDVTVSDGGETVEVSARLAGSASLDEATARELGDAITEELRRPVSVRFELVDVIDLEATPEGP
jgi:uncharacterized hydrophobic protein (TIGR00271 family)